MPLRYEAGDAADALFRTVITRRGEGYAVVSGCGVTVGDSGSDIVVDINTGTIRHDGVLVDVSAQSVTLPDGDPQAPRRDLIYIDRGGSASFVQGEAVPYNPSDRRGDQTWSPAPPAAPALDGVVLATVLVPPGATDSADLPTGVVDADPIRDYRVGDVSAIGTLPERSSDPDAADLDRAQQWLNTSMNSGDGALRFYNSAAEEIVTIQTASATSVNPGQETVIESFDSDISANWQFVDTDEYTYGSPSIEGAAALQYGESGPTTVTSVPGDGLSDYPEEGQTASVAIYYESGADEVNFGIGKEDSRFRDGYFMRFNLNDDEFSVVRLDEGGGIDTLGGPVSVSFSPGNWYLGDIAYDGGGAGVHPAQCYAESGGSRGTQLADIAAPSADTTYRGRGVELSGNNNFAADRYTLQDT